MTTILVVDDEPDILALTSEFLAENGYRVLHASDGTGALAIFEREPDINLIVTDVVMPSMSGLELAERAKRQRPDLRILYVSGYPMDTVWENQRLHGRLLSKPWRPRDLIGEIEAALAE
jgi:CheY-like chemotaxis protein